MFRVKIAKHRIAIRVCLCLVFGYAVVVAAVFALQDRLIFMSQPIDTESAQRIAELFHGERISVEVENGVTVRGWFLPSEIAGRRPVVIFFGGNAMDLADLPPRFADIRAAGVSVALIDYRGYGLSDGAPSMRGFLSDAISVHDAIAARSDVDSDKVYLWGISIGAGVAAHVASVRSVAGVVMTSSFTSLADVADRAYPWLPVRPMLRHRLDPLSLAPIITEPALFFHGEFDEIQPSEEARRTADAWAGEVTFTVLPERDHNTVLGDPLMWDRIGSFVR